MRQRALARLRAFLTSAHAGFLFSILDQNQVSVGFISMNPFPNEVAPYQMTFSFVAPFGDIYGFALKCLNNY